MIGESRSDMNPDQSKSGIAIRDAFIVFVITLVSNLLTAGYPPRPEILYTATLAAALAGAVSYAHALGIEKPQ